MEVRWTPPKARPDPSVEIAEVELDNVDDESGKTIARRFKLIAPIGVGATAVVYRATDLETKSEVAVKWLHRTLRDDPEACRYFAQEGRLTARINHPHLLRAHFYGALRGAPFIVFELVPGMSLHGLAAMRPMPWRRLTTIVIQALDALARLHEEGVVHGDIQPENIIVQQTALGLDFAKVIDLGFASARFCRRLTQAAAPPKEIHATAGFIAPERLAGLEPDARADLYSVGATMYYLLTTRQVPDISLAPDELGVPTLRIMAPGAGIPVAIDAIVMRALSDIDDRFQSAAEMAEALRAALAQPDAPPLVAELPALVAGLPTLAADPPPLVADSPPVADSPTLSEPPAAAAAGRAAPVSEASPHQTAAAANADDREPGPTDLPLGRPYVQSRGPLVLTLCAGVVLGALGFAGLWRAGAALEGSHAMAKQAMDMAPRSPEETASRSHPEPNAVDVEPPPATPLPLPVPLPEPIYKPTIPSSPPVKKPTESRAQRVRSSIHRCKPVMPFAESKVVVQTDDRGQTVILFNGREAMGQFGDCVDRIADRMRLSSDEQIKFQL
jgi:serine/threonine protein kinase